MRRPVPWWLPKGSGHVLPTLGDVELARLRVGRLDLLRCEVAVAEQVVRGEGGRSYLGPPKSRAGRRTMTMPGWVADLLAAHLLPRGLSGADADAFVFEWPSGGHLSYSSRRKHWLVAVRDAGLPDGFGFHDLRRANATGLVAGGIDVRAAQARLGQGHGSGTGSARWDLASSGIREKGGLCPGSASG